VPCGLLLFYHCSTSIPLHLLVIEASAFRTTATMFPNRRQPSYTLPRSFTFHYTDGDAPSTPESSDPHAPSHSPPEPPRQPGPYRLRRRRAARPHAPDYFSGLNTHDVPIPTIELSGPSTQTRSVESLSLLNQYNRPRASPPRTPAPQMPDILSHEDTAMDHTDASSQGESISRPSTACSGFSDSSVSSSIESFPSLGESLNSPDSELLGPHTLGVPGKQALQEPSLPAVRFNPTGIATKAKPSWTEDMDNHLCVTYMRYLQDPTHTPFKMLPGTAPPLGVCSRVVREAKRTWKGHRSSAAASRTYRLLPWGRPGRADSPDTIKAVHSGSSTPTEAHLPKLQHASWPRSDASTRRRLRELCKRKPTLSAYYNRLLTTRSPSPFPSSSRSRASSAIGEIHPHPSSVNTEAFSTRDMTVSLFSTTSNAVSAMNQLTSDSVTPKPRETNPFAVPPSRYGAHQKSQSLQLNLGIGDSSARIDGILASPFQPFAKQNPMAPAETSYLQAPASSAVPQLASPVQLAAPVPQPLIPLAQLQDESLNGDERTSSSPFPDFDSRHGQISNRRGRRGRNRAVSMGDVSASSRRLSLLFDQPSVPLINTQPSFPSSLAGPATLMPPPVFAPMRRLGSPFSEKPSRPFNTFPRNFPLTGLEPTIESQEERQPPTHHH
jgi:hypothetical protein